MLNVGKYTSPIECLGQYFTSRIFLPEIEDFPISFQLPFGVMYLVVLWYIILGRKILMLSFWNCFFVDNNQKFRS